VGVLIPTHHRDICSSYTVIASVYFTTVRAKDIGHYAVRNVSIITLWDMSTGGLSWFLTTQEDPECKDHFQDGLCFNTLSLACQVSNTRKTTGNIFLVIF
jgi:hypothetical protein